MYLGVQSCSCDVLSFVKVVGLLLWFVNGVLLMKVRKLTCIVLLVLAWNDYRCRCETGLLGVLWCYLRQSMCLLIVGVLMWRNVVRRRLSYLLLMSGLIPSVLGVAVHRGVPS